VLLKRIRIDTAEIVDTDTSNARVRFSIFNETDYPLSRLAFRLGLVEKQSPTIYLGKEFTWEIPGVDLPSRQLSNLAVDWRYCGFQDGNMSPVEAKKCRIRLILRNAFAVDGKPFYQPLSITEFNDLMQLRGREGSIIKSLQGGGK
jgi:hypothetical protein